MNQSAAETRIYNLIVLDESGSMDDIREQALTGVNETIQTIRQAQKENPADNQMLSFVTFDQGGDRPDVRLIIDNQKIENVQDVKPEQYNRLQKVVKEGDHVLVTIVTDGYENASRHYPGAMIKELVDSLSAKGWVFTYIGANQDSARTAKGLGIKCTMDFKATIEGSSVMWDRVRSSRREYYKKVRRAQSSGEQIDFEDDFFASRQALNRVTPPRIDFLRDDQIFVFGSNAAGHHEGGAARLALKRFGAVYGQGRGLQGRSYAIPTMGASLETIAREVDEFIRFADIHPEMTFLVTPIGCGNAGFTAQQIAPLFGLAYNLPNVFLPKEFWDVLG